MLVLACLGQLSTNKDVIKNEDAADLKFLLLVLLLLIEFSFETGTSSFDLEYFLRIFNIL